MAGSQPGEPTPIPDVSFRPVSLPPLPGARRGPEALLPGSARGAIPGAVPSPEPASSEPVGLSEDAVVRDMAFATEPPGRAQPSLDAAQPLVVAVPTPTPRPPRTSHSISGLASYYCRSGVSPCTFDHPDTSGVQAYAAAGPRLRASLGADWRGAMVYVDGIRVQLIDWCQCYEGQSNEKLLDLYYDVYSRTGSSVTVRW